MGKDTKPLCKRDKEEVHRSPETLKHISVDQETVEQEYVCRKCGRVAHKERHLCKPEKV